MGRVPQNMFEVKQSNSRDFRPYNLDKNYGGHNMKIPSETTEMTMLDFINKVVGDDASYYYLQSSLGKHSELALDVDVKGNWSECLNIARKCRWGCLMADTLSIGMKGTLIPLHYDQTETILVQIRGYTEIILFDPITAPFLYPFPYGHPCHKQSMVDAEFVGNEKNSHFTKFSPSNNVLNNNVFRGVLEKGDVLYIPCFWWQETVNLNDFAMNVSFCSQASRRNDGGPLDIEQILNNKTIQQKISIGRNIEKIVLSKYGSNMTPMIFESFLNNDEKYTKHRNDIRKCLKNVFNETEEIDQFIHELVEGRYNVDYNQFIKRS